MATFWQRACPWGSAKLTQKAMIRLLKRRHGAVLTITLDNGSAFAGHETVAKKVSASTYFCDPYCLDGSGVTKTLMA